MPAPVRPGRGGIALLPLRLVARALDPLLRRWQGSTGTGGMVALFLLPNMAIFLVFVLIPLGINAVYSTTGGTGIFLSQRGFVGLDQYRRLLDCGSFLEPRSCREDVFWIAVWNTARFALLQVATMTLAALGTALVLNRALAGRGFWRAVFFFPVLLSPVVVGLIWRWILQRNGLANLAMVEMGLEPVNWLLERGWAFAATVGVSVWAHMGFYALILLAGLQAIPRDLYEAAEMDGTPRTRVFLRITLPLLAPNLTVVLVLAMIRAVQIFDEAYVLTAGGPGTATMYLTQYVYETGFASPVRNQGLAAAASLLMAGVLAVLTLLQLWLARRGTGRGTGRGAGRGAG